MIEGSCFCQMTGNGKNENQLKVKLALLLNKQNSLKHFVSHVPEMERLKISWKVKIGAQKHFIYISSCVLPVYKKKKELELVITYLLVSIFSRKNWLLNPSPASFGLNDYWRLSHNFGNDCLHNLWRSRKYGCKKGHQPCVWHDKDSSEKTFCLLTFFWRIK